MASYQAVYDYSSTAEGMLSFRSGDRFTVKNRTNDDWWAVQDAKGDIGLVPVSYLEPLLQGQEHHDGGGAGTGETGEGVFTALYDFTGQDSTQLSFKQGEQLTLLAKTDPSWWTMSSPSGQTGLVPLNYISVDQAASSPSAAGSGSSTATAASSGGVGNSRGSPRRHQYNGGIGEGEALSEVLLSIDRAMEKIHDEAILQGGVYNPQQKATLQSLAVHRKSVVEDSTAVKQAPNYHTPSPTHSHSQHTSHAHTNTTPAPSLMRPAQSSQPKGVAPNGSDGPSPRPKRKAPAPPTNHAPHGEHSNSLPRRSKNLRSSREDLIGDYHSQTLPTRDSDRRDRAHTQPQNSLTAAHRGKSSSHSHVPQNHIGTAQHQGHRDRSQTVAAHPSPSPPSSSNTSPKKSQSRRSSENHNASRGQNTSPSISSPSHPSSQHSQTLQASPVKTVAGRSKSMDVYSHPLPPSSSSPSHHGSPASKKMSSGAVPDTDRAKTTSHSSGASPSSSPQTQRWHDSVMSVPEHPTPPSLPTQFPSSDGTDLIEVVRTRTHLSYARSVEAVTGVLELLKDKIPVCAATMDGLLSAVQQSHANTSPSSARKVKSSADMERLREIFFQLQDVRDDSQQRGWAVHDDLNVIMEYLSELLQILCDADPEVTKAAVQEDKYENILTLIRYYDIESRIPIRLLMLQVFGVLCGLDKEIINVFLGSILPNELGRDIHNHLTEIEKTLYTSTVCTMMFSSGEAVPLTVYDQWSESYISFLMDTIEDPPEEDEQDQIPDAFLNIILSFNQHFTDPDTNLVMNVLKTKQDPRHFSEKFMFLINRGDDPVALQEPLCPDSLTKFALDVFSSKETSGMFYTTDLMVLIDIVLRQISDLCPGDQIRTHYLELLYRIVSSTDYRSHYHRQKEITVVLNRIAQEEGEEGWRDRDVIKKIWIDHSGCFDEITDL